MKSIDTSPLLQVIAMRRSRSSAARLGTNRASPPLAKNEARFAFGHQSAVSEALIKTAFAETIHGLCRAEVIHRCGPWRRFGDDE